MNRLFLEEFYQTGNVRPFNGCNNPNQVSKFFWWLNWTRIGCGPFKNVLIIKGHLSCMQCLCLGGEHFATSALNLYSMEKKLVYITCDTFVLWVPIPFLFKHSASRFNLTYRYIDDVLSINNPEFENYLGQMYPAELEIKDTTESTTSASYLDLLLSIGRDGQLHTSIYDKRDDFNFHITNFPFLSSNIPSSPAYGVFISQLIRYARACSSYECFILRARRLSSKLLKQGYLVERLKSSFRKFYGRYGDLVEQYGVTLSRMLNDILTLDQQWLPYRSDFPPISWSLYRAWPSPNYEWFPWSICNGCG